MGVRDQASHWRKQQSARSLMAHSRKTSQGGVSRSSKVWPPSMSDQTEGLENFSSCLKMHYCFTCVPKRLQNMFEEENWSVHGGTIAGHWSVCGRTTAGHWSIHTKTTIGHWSMVGPPLDTNSIHVVCECAVQSLRGWIRMDKHLHVYRDPCVTCPWCILNK